MHPVISFSVINYVVMMRHPRVSDEVSFCFYISHKVTKITNKVKLFQVIEFTVRFIENIIQYSKYFLYLYDLMNMIY